MAETEPKQPESPVSPLKPSDGGESPTTARPLDFDSDHEATPTKSTKSTEIKPSDTESVPKPPPKDAVVAGAAPPPKPPRPLSPREQAEATLKEAFPSIDASVVKAVLIASGGQIEPAFNALLGMTDPEAQRELESAPVPAAAPPAPVRAAAAAASPVPPTKPPRPQQSQPQNQVDADELYARQLQEHYIHTDQHVQRRASDRFNSNLPPSRPGRAGANPNPEDVPWRSFIDDDLPEIRDNIKKGFIETQTTINKWITNFKKRIDGEDDDSDFAHHAAQPGQAYYGRPSSDSARRSADLQRYDADPQLIDDDFSKLELRDSDSTTSHRPLAGFSRFKPPPPASAMARKSPSPANNSRKVSFQDGPPDEIGDLHSSGTSSHERQHQGTTASAASPAASSATKSSKWQPLSVADPSPIDNDPFSLGDSDDDKDAKPISLKDNDADADADADFLSGDKAEETDKADKADKEKADEAKKAETHPSK